MKVKNRKLMVVGSSHGFIVPANWEHYDTEGILQVGKSYDLEIIPTEEEADK